MLKIIFISYLSVRGFRPVYRSRIFEYITEVAISLQLVYNLMLFSQQQHRLFDDFWRIFEWNSRKSKKMNQIEIDNCRHEIIDSYWTKYLFGLKNHIYFEKRFQCSQNRDLFHEPNHISGQYFLLNFIFLQVLKPKVDVRIRQKMVQVLRKNKSSKHVLLDWSIHTFYPQNGYCT